MVILLHMCPSQVRMGYGQGSRLLLLLACFQTWRLRGTKKIKDVEVQGGIL